MVKRRIIALVCSVLLTTSSFTPTTSHAFLGGKKDMVEAILMLGIGLIAPVVISNCLSWTSGKIFLGASGVFIANEIFSNKKHFRDADKIAKDYMLLEGDKDKQIAALDKAAEASDRAAKAGDKRSKGMMIAAAGFMAAAGVAVYEAIMDMPWPPSRPPCPIGPTPACTMASCVASTGSFFNTKSMALLDFVFPPAHAIYQNVPGLLGSASSFSIKGLLGKIGGVFAKVKALILKAVNNGFARAATFGAIGGLAFIAANKTKKKANDLKKQANHYRELANKMRMRFKKDEEYKDVNPAISNRDDDDDDDDDEDDEETTTTTTPTATVEATTTTANTTTSTTTTTTTTKKDGESETGRASDCFVGAGAHPVLDESCKCRQQKKGCRKMKLPSTASHDYSFAPTLSSKEKGTIGEVNRVLQDEGNALFRGEEGKTSASTSDKALAQLFTRASNLKKKLFSSMNKERKKRGLKPVSLKKTNKGALEVEKAIVQGIEKLSSQDKASLAKVWPVTFGSLKPTAGSKSAVAKAVDKSSADALLQKGKNDLLAGSGSGKDIGEEYLEDEEDIEEESTEEAMAEEEDEEEEMEDSSNALKGDGVSQEKEETLWTLISNAYLRKFEVLAPGK